MLTLLILVPHAHFLEAKWELHGLYTPAGQARASHRTAKAVWKVERVTKVTTMLQATPLWLVQ